MSNYEYKQVKCDVAPLGAFDPGWVAEAANYWMAQGWETVSVIPPNRDKYTYLLIRRPLVTRPYLVGLNVEHDHPLGVTCGESCPVLNQWDRIREQAPRS